METSIEPILSYLQRKLAEAGSDRWEAIAAAAGCPHWLPRKVRYYKPDAKNPSGPGVFTIQPLYDFFRRVDSGDAHLPDPSKVAAAASADAAQASRAAA